MGIIARAVALGAFCTASAFGSWQQNLYEVKPQRADSVRASVYSETFRETSTQSSNSYPSLQLAAKGQTTTGGLDLLGDAEAFLNLHDTGARYLNVREAYVARAFGAAGLYATFGRKLEDWSELDSYWRLGLWQPRFRWDYLAPDVVGLTGLFVSQERPGLRWLVFGSPLSIPELGAQFELKDGQFSSPNRFVALPPSQLKLFGSNLPVRYTLDSTPITDLVFNPSGGAMVRLGEKLGPWAKLSYAYEPVNRIMLGYEGYLYVANRDIEVTLHPRVVYHHLAALEAGVNRERWRGWFSVLGERPVSDRLPGHITTEQLAPALLASAAFDFDAFSTGAGVSRATLGYIQSWGGVKPDEGPLGVPGKSIFESRYPYRSAAQAALGVPLAGGGEARRLDLAGRAIYEFAVLGALLSLDLNYHLNNRWSFELGADALGSVRESAPTGGADFFSLFRSDDRIRGRVSYFF